jgi:Holliday junction resolvase
MKNKVEIPTLRSEAMPLKLEDEDRQKLMQMAQQGGYKVLLRMMEAHCIKQDIILQNVDAADEKRVLAEHRIGKGMWDLFAVIQKQVQQEVDNLMGQGDGEGGPSEEEREVAGIVSAI